MKVLFVFGQDCADYMSDLLLHGFRAIVGADNVFWWPAKAHLGVADVPDRVPEVICHAGAPDRSVPTPDAVDLAEGDLVVLGSARRGDILAAQRMMAARARDRGATVVAIDGEDAPNAAWADAVRVFAHVMFLRECGPGSYSATPIAIPFNPAFVGRATNRWIDRGIGTLWAGQLCGQRAAWIDPLRCAFPLGAIHAGQIEWDAWRSALVNSRACICLRGAGAQTYRMWEAAAAGCVPVVERLGFAIPHGLEDGVSMVEFSGVDSILLKLTGPRAGPRMAARAHATAWAYHTPAATAQYVLACVEEAGA